MFVVVTLHVVVNAEFDEDWRMPEGYGLDCPVACTLDVIGERWSLLILRDLFLQGPRKFQDFESSLEGISPNTLSLRLKHLEDAEVIERRFYEEHPPRAEYVLTPKGRELGPILKALRAWGRKNTAATT
jgi:DNA-binding HxlR family transcriptional regulator